MSTTIIAIQTITVVMIVGSVQRIGIGRIDATRPEDQNKAGDKTDRQTRDREHDHPAIDGRQIFEAWEV